MSKYNYKKKRCIMSDTEREFFSYLMEAVNGKYTIFPQVHIDLIAESQGFGKYKFKGWAHVSRKSVDFILVDHNKGFETLCAIELNDKSHLKKSRRKRDVEVNKILESINMPLLTIEVANTYSVTELSRMIEIHMRNR